MIYGDWTGLRNDRPDYRFTKTDLVTGINIDIDNSGLISRRPGTTKLNSAQSHSLWSDNKIAFVVSGGALNLVNDDYTLTPIMSVTSNRARMSYEKMNDRIYFSNGIDSGVYENNSLRSWGLPVPPVPGAFPSVGNMHAGTYQFVVTYLRADGQESGAGPAGVMDLPANGGIIFSLPVSSDSGVVAKSLYMTTSNGEILYLADTVPAARVEYEYRNDSLDLSFPLQTQFKSAPPPGHKVKYYRGHIYVASNEMIFPSEDLAYELFDVRKAFYLDSRVTMIASMEDKEEPGDTQGTNSGLFVGTQQTTGVLIGKSTIEAQYVPKMEYGAVEGADTLVDGSLFGDDSVGARKIPVWLSREGVCVGMSNMNIVNLTRTKYGFTADGVGAAFFMPGPNKFIATCNY